jgi:uncharacterized protein
VKRAWGFVRSRPGLAAMLVFLALFYGSAAYFHAQGRRAAEAGHEVSEASKRMTSAEVREMEDRFRRNLQSRPRAMQAAGTLFLAVLSAALFADAWLLFRKAKGKPLLAGVEHAAVPWGLLDVFSVFVLLLFLEAALLVAETALFAALGRQLAGHDVLVMINSLVRDVVVVVLLVVWVRRRFGRPARDLGLTAREWAKNVARGLAGYLAVIPPLLVILFVMSLATKAVSYEPSPQPVVEMYLREERQGTLIFFTVFVAVFGPVMEELFFRGFAYPAFRTRFGAKTALLASAGIFALLHASAVAFVPIFLLGLFLGYLYERTGSLVPGITAHMTHNLIMVGCTLGFKTLAAGGS